MANDARHEVGLVDEFESNAFRIVSVAGRSVGVVRTASGFFAVLNRCPHQAAEICRGRVEGTMAPSRPREYVYSESVPVLTCPWHRWQFELETGLSVGRVTPKRLVTFDVEVEDGRVYVKPPRRRGER